MIKPKLYLHIGTHKTGSTTLQSVLKKESNKLKEEGIAYLGRFRDISKPMKGMTKYDDNHVRKFRKEAQQLIDHSKKSNPHTYVASNEKWSGHDMLSYDNAPVNAKMLYDIFKPFDFDIKIIVYLRRQDKFFESAYAQKIKRGGTFSFEEYLKQIKNIKGLHWDSHLDSYAAIFGKENIIVQRFDKAYLPQKNSLIHSFANIINSKHLKNFDIQTVENRGYSKDVMEFARLSNKYLTREEIRTLKYLLIDVNLPKDNYTYFPLEQRKELLLNYDESNRKVAREYLNEPDGELFSKTDLEQNKSGETYQGLTTEALALIFSKTILVLEKRFSSQIEETRKMYFHKRVYRKFRRLLQKINLLIK